MNRTRQEWEKVKPDAFLEGSIVQARNIIEMMQHDIGKLYASIEIAVMALESGNITMTTKGLRKLLGE